MNAPRANPAFAVVFAVVFAIAYTVCVDANYALFTYHPVLNEFGLGVQQPKEGPAMYWYGWMATAAIVAAAAGIVARLLPDSVTRRIWAGLVWLVPLAMMAVFAYILRGYFLR
jgi:hypothetical protein